MTERVDIAGGAVLMRGACEEVLCTLPDASVHAIVTDPPYGLSKLTPEVVRLALLAWLNDEPFEAKLRGFMGKCVHPDTDVLTPDGWRRVKDVPAGAEVYTLNPDTGAIEVTTVARTHAYPFQGQLVHVDARSVEQVVTPNHNLWLGQQVHREGKRPVVWRFKRADEAPRVFLQSNQGSWSSGEDVTTIEAGGQSYPAASFLSFLGLFLGDGYTVSRQAQPEKQDFFGFSVKKSRKQTAIRAALKGCGVRFTENATDTGAAFYVYDKALLTYLKALGGAHEKFIPADLFRLSSALLENLYRGLIETDGTRQGPKGQEVYFTVSKQLADDFQHLCFLTGRSCTLTRRKAPTTFAPEGAECWVASVLSRGKVGCWLEKNGRANRPQPANVKQVDYSGPVYCLELVHHHIMLTRFNGKSVWTGNSWDGFVPGPLVWREVYRVLKPGGHALVFGGTRSYDLMALSLRLAGFEIRDTIKVATWAWRRRGLVAAKLRRMRTDSLAWVYGSGFPKSTSVEKEIDKQRDDREEILQVTAWIRAVRDAAGVTNAEIDAAFGTNGMAGHWTSGSSQPAVPQLAQLDTLFEALRVQREDVPAEIAALIWRLNGRKGQPGDAWFTRAVVGTRTDGAGNGSVVGLGSPRTMSTVFEETAPATPAAKRYKGWGTALKPAWEPIIVARKPLIGTIAQNVLAHGTGGLNIDACRVATAPDDEVDNHARGAESAVSKGIYGDSSAQETHQTDGQKLGRWPPNVVLCHHPGCRQVGTAKVAASSGIRPDDVGTDYGKEHKSRSMAGAKGVKLASMAS